MQTAEESGEAKRSYVVKQEGVNFGYDAYISYATTTSTPTTVNQPLPGQPPLPPMPPPPTAAPPPPHVYVPSQVTPIQTWPHAPPHWQWIAQQATALSSQTARDIATNFQRGNFVKRERFNNNNRNNVYNQRNNFHRKNNRRIQRFESPQGQFDQNYFGSTLQGNIGLDWQRNNYSTTGNEAIVNQMPINISNQMGHLNSVVTNRRANGDSEIKISSVSIFLFWNKIGSEFNLKYIRFNVKLIVLGRYNGEKEQTT